MCRLAMLLISIFLLSFITPAFSQSLLLNRNESGLGIDVAYHTGSSFYKQTMDVSAATAAIGIGIKGWVDLGYIYQETYFKAETDLPMESYEGFYFNICLYKQGLVRHPKSIFYGGTYIVSGGKYYFTTGIVFIQKSSPGHSINIWPSLGIATTVVNGQVDLKNFTIAISLPISYLSREDRLKLFITPGVAYSSQDGSDLLTASLGLGLIYLFSQ